MRWRDRARQWLRADLTAWGQVLDGNPAARERARKTLTHWQGDPDLAGLCELAELNKLSTDERTDCIALWDEVGGVLKHTNEIK